MKVLEIHSFKEGIHRNIAMLDRLGTEMDAIQQTVQGLVVMEDSLKGEGGNAIRAFYAECHLPFQQFFKLFQIRFVYVLKQMDAALDTLESNPAGFIHEGFLKDEVEPGLKLIAQLTDSLTEEANSIMNRVADIVALPHLDDSEVQEGVHHATIKRKTTVTQLHEFDATQTIALTPIEQDLATMDTWIADIERLFTDGVTDIRFSSDQWANLSAQNTLKTDLVQQTAAMAGLPVMMGINGQPTTQLGALLAGQDPIRFGYGFVDGPNLLYELGILTFPGMATYGKPITKVNGAEDAVLQAFFKELAKQPNSAAPGNPNPIDPVTGDYVMMNQGVVRVSKDYGPRELSLIDKAGLAVANFFILNDLNTIKDSNASIPEKGLAAASIIPIGRLLKLDELDFILKKESPAVGVISSGKGGKVADKGTGTNSKKANGAYKFNFVENAKKHLKNVENVNTKKGIVGGHNMDEFNKALKSQGFNPNDLIVSKKPHPSIEGIYEIEYKIPRKDMAGNIAEPVSYKNIKEPKTVYDPSKISDDKIYQWGQEAMQNGKINGRLVEGTASNGLKYRGYLNEAGEITNFFPIID